MGEAVSGSFVGDGQCLGVLLREYVPECETVIEKTELYIHVYSGLMEQVYSHGLMAIAYQPLFPPYRLPCGVLRVVVNAGYPETVGQNRFPGDNAQFGRVDNEFAVPRYRIPDSPIISIAIKEEG